MKRSGKRTASRSLEKKSPFREVRKRTRYFAGRQNIVYYVGRRLGWVTIETFLKPNYRKGVFVGMIPLNRWVAYDKKGRRVTRPGCFDEVIALFETKPEAVEGLVEHSIRNGYTKPRSFAEWESNHIG